MDKQAGKFPETPEDRRAGMAAVRARMLAAHQRQIDKGTLKPRDEAAQRDMVAHIKAEQEKRGEA